MGIADKRNKQEQNLKIVKLKNLRDQTKRS